MKTTVITLISLALVFTCYSQNEEQSKFPFSSVYIGTAVPIISIDEDGFTSNFSTSSVFVFPIGFNLNKSEKLSYSIELDPVLSFTNNSSSIANLAVLPGVLLHQEKISYGIRAAFETSGRYGMSFSLLKSLIKKENFNLVMGIPLDIRTGNQTPVNLGTGLIFVIVL